ncbi:DNA methyltransferase [Brevibacillus sp. GCM10020057]|uniref:DNA methyltransferase n=1 Tax=Brevibacillus sp. GCM10020057 TaxID=3317327 RepID=UPI003644759C
MKKNRLYEILGVNNDLELKEFARKSGVSVKKLKYYSEELILPAEDDLQKILQSSGLTELEFKLKLGILDRKIISILGDKASEISQLLGNDYPRELQDNFSIKPCFQTELGKLYQADCLQLMRTLPKESVDLIFADPPFNLNKSYESGINDKLSKMEYLDWTEEWVLSCVNLLKEGGSFFVWNLPIWNTYISEILNRHLTFRHWIAVDIKYRLPIQNRLYPSHYSLLYYTKGEKPSTFNTQRLPLEICRHCGGDYRDYGGYKDKLNINGINLSDVWYDIPPVRHSKYKTRESNELSLKLLDRIISLASNEGDLVFDPFGGSGTTYITSELLGRNWIGCEIGPINTIINRFQDIQYHREYLDKIRLSTNKLFTEEARRLREKNGHWLPETLNKKKNDNKAQQLDIFEK